jgi:membrane peptidoglycan carboxypeptidase
MSTYNLITDTDGNIVQKNHKRINKVFSEDTVCLVNDMLNETAKSGTAKKLASSIDLCAKTGTVGTKDGNTDAYCISYNTDYCLCVWFGGKGNELLPNSITGGGFPTEASKNIWDQIYLSKPNVEAFTIPQSVEKIYLDKISYDNYKIELADKNAPKRYIKEVLCAKDRIPNKSSSRFSYPEIENAKSLSSTLHS